MKKPKLNPDNIAIYRDKIYFGDDKLQEKAIQLLQQGLSKPGNIYIIVGPARSGKDSTFTHGTRRLDKRKFNVIDYDASDSREWRYDLDNDPNVHNVIRLAADLFADRSLQPAVDEANAILKEYPNSSIILDVVQADTRPVSYLGTEVELRATRGEDAVVERVAKSQNNIVVLRTGYDLTQVQQALWDLAELLKQKFSDVGLGMKEEFFSGNNQPDLIPMFQALNEGNKTKYDLAFERIRSLNPELDK